MKILIMSVTAGEGHNSTAKAMKTYFESCKNVCNILDTYKYVSPALAKFVSQGYLFVSEKAKDAFALGYRMAEKRRSNSHEISTARIVNMVLVKEIHEYIDQFKPDIILFTHPFAGIIIDIMKQKGIVRTKVVGIVTDFTLHPYWEECLYSDYIVVPSPLLKYQAKLKGFSDEQILPFGIPINPKFKNKIPKEEARRQIGLEPDINTIMFMTGSMGYGHLKKRLIELDNIDAPFDFQIICVCGKNETEKEKIDKTQFSHRVLSLGYVGNIDLLMDASDCLIGKPGGLSTSEALAKRLPMIITDPIPGQEKRNTEFLLNNGAAVATSPTCKINELVYQLFTNPVRLETMLTCIDSIRKPDSAKDVCEFVMKLALE